MRTIMYLALLLSVGCAGPRFVQVSSDEAVVAMPDYSNCWPHYYRDNAEKMLKSRFPSGYVIEKEEEVVVGTRTYTNGRTDTEAPPALMLGGSEEQSVRTGNRERTSGSFGGIAIPLGETRQKHEETTSTYNQTEWRMYIRSATATAKNPPLDRVQIQGLTMEVLRVKLQNGQWRATVRFELAKDSSLSLEPVHELVVESVSRDQQTLRREAVQVPIERSFTDRKVNATTTEVVFANVADSTGFRIDFHPTLLKGRMASRVIEWREIDPDASAQSRR